MNAFAQHDRSTNSDLKSIHEAHHAFKSFFLNEKSETLTAYKTLVSEVAAMIATQIKQQQQPYNGSSSASLLQKISTLEFFPAKGKAMDVLLHQTRELIIESNISVYHPHCLAHLHCPPLMASLAAEMIISAFNQSMDSWDQAPVASMIEQALCEQLCKIFEFGPESDATFTGGGTMSNFMGLLLARDQYSKKHFNHDIQQKGLPPEASRFRILCAQHAHFTVAQSAAILGLGHDAVVKIEDDGLEETTAQLERSIEQLLQEGLIPIAYVATAGTTDYGSIASIGAMADCAHRYGMWVHIDAAYGGALIFSKNHKHKLAGIEKADSVTIDFHKLFYQPISCGVFMVKNKTSFELIRLHADYLNPEGNEALGLLDLVYKSIQTTRRFDALKPFLALQHVGTETFGDMLDYTIALAENISDFIEADPQFELAYRTPINAIVFRYLPEGDLSDTAIDNINDQLKTTLLLSGKAIVGQTRLHEKSFLKFTLLNPMTTADDIIQLLNEVKQLAKKLV